MALWTDPDPLGGSFEGWVQAVEVIRPGTRATGLQVNATLASSAVFIMVDLILQEKSKDGLDQVNPPGPSPWAAITDTTTAASLIQRHIYWSETPWPLKKTGEITVYESKYKQMSQQQVPYIITEKIRIKLSNRAENELI